MKLVARMAGAVAFTVAALPALSLAQQQPASPPFTVGNPVGFPVTPATNGAFDVVSSNVKVYGAIYSAESCSYDAQRGVIVVPNRVMPQNVQANDAFVSSQSEPLPFLASRSPSSRKARRHSRLGIRSGCR